MTMKTSLSSPILRPTNILITVRMQLLPLSPLFFFNDPATTEISLLPLPAALPISPGPPGPGPLPRFPPGRSMGRPRLGGRDRQSLGALHLCASGAAARREHLLPLRRATAAVL